MSGPWAMGLIPNSAQASMLRCSGSRDHSECSIWSETIVSVNLLGHESDSQHELPRRLLPTRTDVFPTSDVSLPTSFQRDKGRTTGQNRCAAGSELVLRIASWRRSPMPVASFSSKEIAQCHVSIGARLPPRLS